jgi:2-succinyl-6-hydroxy-2,4-cyclohexadiene-1-carboxylate synthase
MTPSLIALHGFLGEAKDFLPLELEGLYAPHLCHLGAAPLWSWAQRFNRHIIKPPVLLGYSMGGRLALHCIISAPQRYKAAIIIAAHPGLKKNTQQEDRALYDQQWATTFLHKPWQELMQAWNDQEILRSSQPIERREEDFDRAYLARCLRYFSLGEQDYLVPLLNNLELPILWLSPENEADKVSHLSLKNPLSKLLTITHGSHRCLFEKPKIMSSIIRSFITKIKKAKL